MSASDDVGFLGKIVVFCDRRSEVFQYFGIEQSRCISVIVSLPEFSRGPELCFENDPTAYFSLADIEILQVLEPGDSFLPLAVGTGF